MYGDDDHDDLSAGHEACLNTGDPDEIIDFVRTTDKLWPRVVDLVRWDEAREWQKEGDLWLQILTVVADQDQEHFKRAVREQIHPTPEAHDADLAEAELFRLAAAISALVESRRSPLADRCQVGDDLGWVREVVHVTRAFRAVLFGVAGDTGVREELHAPLAVLNAARNERGTPEVVASWIGVKSVSFQEREPARAPLGGVLAAWGLKYLTTHRLHLNLAFCAECGRIYERERRDHVYCSKTCQNRVAYKRKRIFDAGVLAAVPVTPSALDALQRGLWLHHPRLGLGMVEAVAYAARSLWVSLKNGDTFKSEIPAGVSAEMHLARLQESRQCVGARGWEEIREPHSLEARVRFPHLVRTFSFSDLFAKRGESAGSFYTVQDAKKFAELL